jgi:hypothetical protein
VEKDTFDAYIELAKFRRARWENRNQLEWRIAFSLWALLAAAIYYSHAQPLPVWFAILVWTAHALLLSRIRVRNHEDNWLAFSYLLEAEKILTLSPKTRVYGNQIISGAEAWDGFWQDYAPLAQVSVTAALLAVPYLGITIPN